MADTMRTKKEWCQEETKRLHAAAAAELTATNVELKCVQNELRITKILKNDLEMKWCETNC